MLGKTLKGLRGFYIAAGFLLALPGLAQTQGVEHNPVLKKPVVPAEDPALQRILLKLRVSDTDRARAQSAPGTSADEASERRSRRQARIQGLAQRVGLALREAREISPDLQVISVGPALYGEPPDETLARLRADPSVEFAEIDQRRYAHAIPNDPFFQPGNSVNGQWYLGSDAATPAAINAVAAWDSTTGGAGIVIAILDTGVLFDHPDLRRVADGGRLLPGYDFVSADFNSSNSFLIANDGNGRDADASDPGDWINSTDRQNSRFSDCEISDSSWHGTRVAGIIGARTNTSTPEGIAGITWSPLLLPVRVLGKCGGFDSDIIPAMRWAAGLSVSGVPNNPHPAKIINLSLGSETTCSQSYRNVISELTALGVLVVASAGNETGHRVDSPANCPGVLGVAGLRHIGTKVSYSNLGPEIGISTPAGNCGAGGGVCLYSIDTTVNTGRTVPDPSGHTYTNSINTNLGTSFSAPIVAAAAALVRSLDAALTPAQVIARLQQTATAFPSAAGIPACQDPETVSNADQFECNCSTATCGAGMLNVAAAVAATLPPPPPPPPPSPDPQAQPASTGGGGGGGGGAFGPEVLLLGLLLTINLRREPQWRERRPGAAFHACGLIPPGRKSGRCAPGARCRCPP